MTGIPHQVRRCADGHMYTWHVSFEDVPAVQMLAANARTRLANLPELDFVPGQRLHLTMQDVGFSNEISDTELTAIVSAARMRLAAAEPLPVMIGPARATSEGVSCDIVRADVLDLLRDVLRAAIADVRGPERVLEGPMKTPHLSVAYATAAGSARSVDTTLNNEDVTAVVMVRTIQLVRLDANPRANQWETCASIQLG